MVSIAPVHLCPRPDYIDGTVYSSLFPSDCCTKIVHSFQSVYKSVDNIL
jgi:hypothetical protein